MLLSSLLTPGKIALGNAKADAITIAHPDVWALTEAITYWIEQAPAPPPLQ